MANTFARKIFKKMGYEKMRKPYNQKFSVLNSKEFALEERTPKESVLQLIHELKPYNVGIDLIRLGDEGDGGYLVPDDLEGITACFSPGVSSISKFEKECSRRGMKLFLADKSVEKAMLDVEHSFIKKFIGCTNNSDFVTMNSWVEDSVGRDYNNDMLLQMDIEGYEYMTLINMSNALLNKFRIIVLEFHELHKFWLKSSFEFMSAALYKLLESHVCVHIHPNNGAGVDVQDGIEIPRLAEFTFIRKDRVKQKELWKTFPNELDSDCTRRPHVVLPDVWYK
jgi:hypothetical protein